MFCLFPEFHTYQQWWTAEAIAEVLEAKTRRPALLVTAQRLARWNGPQLVVPDAAVACARLARHFAGAATARLTLVGITGTNGKTTTAHLVRHGWTRLGVPAAALGTLGLHLPDGQVEAGEYTTDLAIDLHRKLARVVRAGGQAVAAEVSSHALSLGRVAEVPWAATVLTNLARDHLDFHGSLEAYRAAKRRLFETLAPEALAVLNSDDPVAAEFAAAARGRVLTYGSGPVADLRLLQTAHDARGTRFAVEMGGMRYDGATELLGRFQLENLLAAAAVLWGLGHPPAGVLEALATARPVSGRMERIALRSGALAVIDYAHNPDGLRSVLLNCRPLAARRLIVVFGCGGDRDRGKRPLMGGIAEELADAIWITSDNPRTEDPRTILEDIRGGLHTPQKAHYEPDRALAIAAALEASGEGDCVVIAGKGHEDYQIVGTTKRPFSDHAVVAAWNTAAGPEA
ncbi:MAG: UDP-N-acetylmuramoyl-L-alanyl-D-glutamate--2,6-diaminopimelate ligase [Opitutales bacterium]